MKVVLQEPVRAQILPQEHCRHPENQGSWKLSAGAQAAGPAAQIPVSIRIWQVFASCHNVNSLDKSQSSQCTPLIWEAT